MLTAISVLFIHYLFIFTHCFISMLFFLQMYKLIASAPHKNYAHCHLNRYEKYKTYGIDKKLPSKSSKKR